MIRREPRGALVLNASAVLTLTNCATSTPNAPAAVCTSRNSKQHTRVPTVAHCCQPAQPRDDLAQHLGEALVEPFAIPILIAIVRPSIQPRARAHEANSRKFHRLLAHALQVDMPCRSAQDEYEFSRCIPSSLKDARNSRDSAPATARASSMGYDVPACATATRSP